MPDELKRTLGNLGRFGHIELPGEPTAPAVPTELCPGCGQANEVGSLECRSCRRILEPDPKIVPQGAELVIVLDGQTFRSSDKDLPEDISVLMRQIREKGYTPKLVADWRSWRATRRSGVARGPHASKPAPVLRIDGRLLRLSDPALPEDLRVLFAFIGTHGITQALVSHLRELGHDVRYDPDAEGGQGLLEVRTGASGLSMTQKRALRFIATAVVVWLILSPFKNVLPETFRPMLYLLPLGIALSWSLR